jgi:hypothetical protein
VTGADAGRLRDRRRQRGRLGIDTNVALLGGAASSRIFLAIEARVAEPLMPLGLFRSTTLNAANAIGILWSAAMFAWFFLSALYLQRVLGYSAMQVGLAFLPSNLIMAACSLGVSARTCALRPLGAAGRGPALCRARPGPVRDRTGRRFVPARRATGNAAARPRRGNRLQPLAAGGNERCRRERVGTRLGNRHTSFMMGGALGLAVLASLAAAYRRRRSALRRGRNRRAQRQLSPRFRYRRDLRVRRGGARSAAHSVARSKPSRRRKQPRSR